MLDAWADRATCEFVQATMSVVLARRLAALSAPRCHVHHGQVAIHGDGLLDLACALLPTRPVSNVKVALERHRLSGGLQQAARSLNESPVS